MRARYLTHLLAVIAYGSPDGLADVEPDLRIVARRGPSGFGVVATPDNLITALIRRSPAAEDGLLRVGDFVLEIDGERIPPGESLVSVVKRQQRDAYTLGVLRPSAEAQAQAQAKPVSLAEIVKSMLGNEQIRGAVSKMAVSMVKGTPMGGDGTSASLLAGGPHRPLLADPRGSAGGAGGAGGGTAEAAHGGVLVAPGSMGFDEAQAEQLVSDTLKVEDPCSKIAHRLEDPWVKTSHFVLRRRSWQQQWTL